MSGPKLGCSVRRVYISKEPLVRVLCSLLLGWLTIGIWHISPSSIWRALFRSFVRFPFYNSDMSSTVSTLSRPDHTCLC